MPSDRLSTVGAPDRLGAGAITLTRHDAPLHRVCTPPRAAGQATPDASRAALRRTGSGVRDYAAGVEAADPPEVTWRFTTGATVAWPPVVTGGVAYVADRAGTVCALDARTGQPHWRYQHRTTRFNEVCGPPVVLGDVVLVDVDEWLFAHERSTGQVRWSVPAAGSHLTSCGDRVIACTSKRVSAWDPDSGQRLWASPRNDGLLHAPPAVTDDLVLCSLGFEPNHVHGGLRVYRVGTGRRAWTIDEATTGCSLGDSRCEDQLVLGPFPVTPHRDTIRAVRLRDHHAGDRRYEIVGFDVRTGTETAVHCASWLADDDHVTGAVAVGDDLVYCPAGRRLDAVAADSGVLRWTARFTGQVVGSAVDTRGTVHVATDDGHLHSLDRNTGTVRWSLPVDGPTDWADNEDDESYGYRPAPTPFVHTGHAIYVTTGPVVLALTG